MRLPIASATLAAAAVAACGSLDSNTDRLPTLATIQGTLENPSMLAVAGSVRVAVIWRVTASGFRVAQDLPVQPVFPSKFTIELDGPPPQEAMNVAGAGAPPPSSSDDAGSGPAPSTTSLAGGGGDGGLTMQSLHALDVGGSGPTEFAVGTVVAYADRNGNGKLDLVEDDAGAYIDEIVATNAETSILYIQGPIPSRDAGTLPVGGQVPREGYNLLAQPPCGPPSPQPMAQAPVNPFGWPPNAACPTTMVPDAGAPHAPVFCPVALILPASTPFVLTVASSPAISSVMCVHGGPGTQATASAGGGGAGPYDPSVQPAAYPDPCDPNLQCSPDGSEYQYADCTTVYQGLCREPIETCNFVGYARPMTIPAGWPCIH
jgi:hypothetical protein